MILDTIFFNINEYDNSTRNATLGGAIGWCDVSGSALNRTDRRSFVGNWGRNRSTKPLTVTLWRIVGLD